MNTEDQPIMGGDFANTSDYNCKGKETKAVEFKLKAGVYTLQLSHSSDKNTVLAVTKI